MYFKLQNILAYLCFLNKGNISPSTHWGVTLGRTITVEINSCTITQSSQFVTMQDLVIPRDSTTLLWEMDQLVIPRESCQELYFHQRRETTSRVWTSFSNAVLLGVQTDNTRPL